MKQDVGESGMFHAREITVPEVMLLGDEGG
jgi:hypothetical protein